MARIPFILRLSGCGIAFQRTCAESTNTKTLLGWSAPGQVQNVNVLCDLNMPAKTGQCPYGPTNSFTFRTPIGDMAMTCCPRGLHTLGMAGEITDENFSPKPNLDVCLLSQLYQDNGYMYKPATQCLQWLQTYFHSKDKQDLVKPSICPHIGKEGSFRYKVWFTLLNEIPFGKTISYKCLAELCGNVKACRAIGQAMSNNPVSFVIPCHRVIQENGGLGNYSHGKRNKMKEWLLRHEGVLK